MDNIGRGYDFISTEYEKLAQVFPSSANGLSARKHRHMVAAKYSFLLYTHHAMYLTSRNILSKAAGSGRKFIPAIQLDKVPLDACTDCVERLFLRRALSSRECELKSAGRYFR